MIREVLFRRLIPLKSTTYATHGLYMYPAKFIPQVVRYAIEKYTREGDWVFDPFAGYGTVAIEASLTNRNAILWDLNPITEVLTLASLYKWDITSRDFELDWNYNNPFIPKWENIHYWYPREIYEVLSRCWGYWHNEIFSKAKSAKEIQKACLVAIALFKVSRYFSYSDEKIAKLYKSKQAVEKINNLLSRDWKLKMIKMYWENVSDILEKINEYRSYNPKNVEILIRTSKKEGNNFIIFDAINEKINKDVRLLITSPPYLQAQEYIRSFKLELAWLGFTGSELSSLINHEIPYNNPPKVEIKSKLFYELREEIKKLNHSKLLELYDSYFYSLIKFLNNNYEKFDTVAIFVGPVKIRNIRIPIDSILQEHLENLGFKHVETLIDKIVSRRLFKVEVNPATGIIDERTPTEHLLIMKNSK